MKKIIILIGALILLYVAWDYYKAFSYHSKISYDNVESAWIGKESKSIIILTKDQQKEMVEAFNSAKFVNDNDELAGPTYRCSGEIQLRTGHSINLSGCGKIIEVQRDDNAGFGNKSTTGIVAYFIESQEVERLLTDITD